MVRPSRCYKRAMKAGRLMKWTLLAIGGAVSMLTAFGLIQHPAYNLMLIHPLVLLLWYVAFYGGGLAIVLGLLMAVREVLRR